MNGTGWLIRRQLRRRWAGVVALALIVMLGAGGALVALGASQRTADAFSRYADRAAVGDLVINPSLNTTAGDALIRSLPGVRTVTRDVLFLTTIDDGHPRTIGQLNSDPSPGQVRGSSDGRYTRMDRLAYAAGRAPTGRAEAVVTTELASARHIHLGDTLPVAFWNAHDDGFAPVDAMLHPAGVEHVTVVGIMTMPDQVLPDGVYPRGSLIVSPDVAGRYDCLPVPPPPEASLDEAVAQVFPIGCSLSYPYYSLDLTRGSAGVAAATHAFEAGATRLNAQLPPAVAEAGAGYAPLVTTTAQEQGRVERSVQPAAITLGVLAAGAGVVALVVMGLGAARDHRRAEPDQLQWWRLGMTSGDRALVALAPHLLALVIGAAGSLLVAWVLSPIAPFGVVRALDRSPGRELSAWVLLAAAAFVVAAAALIIGLAVRSSRRVGAAPAARRGVGGIRRTFAGAGRPEVVHGIRAAFASRGSGLVIASGALAAGVLVGAVVFGASLSSVVSTPASYGWPWDAAVMGGYGYGRQDLPAVEKTLARRSDITSWSGFGFGSFTVDGKAVVTLVGLGPPATLDLTVAQGRLPAGKAEVALGSRTAAARGLGVGDKVRVAGDGLDARRATVTGIVVLPALGPFQADRAEPGTGMLLPAAMFDPQVVADQIGFFGLHLAPGASPKQVLGSLQHRDLVSWAAQGDPSFTYADPLRPPEIVNAASMRAIPLLVGGLLAVAAAVGLAFAVAMSVRGRRRELGTLRALGFTGRQLRLSVAVQSTATTAAALVVGVPLGIVAGRLAWRAFALRLGVATDPSISVGWILATVAGGLLISLVAAAVPARTAARATPGAVLRSE